MKRVITCVVILTIVFCWFVGKDAWGAEFCVTNATELQAALDAAEGNSADDVIKVVQGTYTGNFIYDSSKGYSITLKGGYTSGCASRVVDPSLTILDGNNSGRVLFLNDTNGGDIFVEGFTIRDGYNTACCGGVDAISQSTTGIAGDVTFINNIITGNSSEDYGGGVCVTSWTTAGGTAGNVILANNIVTGNSAVGDGGGVFASSTSVSGTAGTITLTNNTVTGNSADNGGGGLPFYLWRLWRRCQLLQQHRLGEHGHDVRGGCLSR